MKHLRLFWYLLALSGCAENQVEHQVCQDPASLIQLLANSAFYRRGNSPLVLFYTYQGAKKNLYFVESRPQGDTLRNLHLEYPPAQRLTRQYAVRTIHALHRQLDSLGIREYVGVPDGLGVQLSVHLLNGRVLYQARDTTSISYAPTRAYIRQSTPLCQHWYRSEY
jgi:hypothetical protein